jgi:putative ABC transport system ATP-binding protein
LETLIKVEEIRKVYRMGNEKVVALDNVSFEIQKGEICALLGTSGSGKSTLLNLLAGLEKPTKGSIKIRKVNIEKLNENQLALFRQKFVGFVFQAYNLLPSLTAIENVSIPLTFRGVHSAERNKQAIKMLKAVGLSERLKHKPNQMSGGQQQRVSIARAFISKPEIIFADEPTGNLDSKTTIEVMELMMKMVKENNQTLIIVTHDVEIAKYANKVIYIKDGNIDKIQINYEINKGETI